MFFMQMGLDELNNRDVMSRLAPRSHPMAEHEAKRRLQHCFVHLLKTGLLVDGKNFLRSG